MSAKALLQVDVQIALLRDEGEARETDVVKSWELQRLLQRREELIPLMVAERLGDLPMAA